MPSQRRSSSRRRSSAVKKIQERFRSKQTRKQRSKANQRIETIVRGIKSRKLISRVKRNILEDNNCPICLEPMTKTEKVATLLPCGHRFHTQCARDALTSTHGKCPICKSDVTNIQPQARPLVQEEQEQLQREIAELLADIESFDARVERASQRPTTAYRNQVLEGLSDANINRSSWWPW